MDRQDKRGATLMAYALMIGLVSVVALSMIDSTGSSVTNLMDSTATQIDPRNIADPARVNDPPSITLAGSQSLDVGGSLPISVPNFITSFDPGPSEDGQSPLAYHLTLASGPGNIASGVAISTDGTLSYTATGNEGTDTYQVVVQDDGGSANGGTDMSAPVSFSITNNGPAIGEALLATPSSFNWEVPTGVSSVSVVVVGGGGCRRHRAWYRRWLWRWRRRAGLGQ